MNTDHQFKNNGFYLPKWELDYLFIGTFNPSGGEKTPYFYGRKKNRFWKLLSELFETDLDPKHDSFFAKLEKLKMGCVDLIDSIAYPEDYADRLLGKGYSDGVLFLSDIEKTYNTKNILALIHHNGLRKVYFTNSGKSLRKEQRLELDEIQKVCEVIYLCSPSPINPHRSRCLDDYKQKITL